MFHLQHPICFSFRVLPGRGELRKETRENSKHLSGLSGGPSPPPWGCTRRGVRWTRTAGPPGAGFVTVERHLTPG